MKGKEVESYTKDIRYLIIWFSYLIMSFFLKGTNTKQFGIT